MRVPLVAVSVFASGLTQAQADDALAKAERSRAAEFWDFRLGADPRPNGWALIGSPRGLMQAAGDPSRRAELEIEVADE